jgi:hypothetical protein
MLSEGEVALRLTTRLAGSGVPSRDGGANLARLRGLPLAARLIADGLASKLLVQARGDKERSRFFPFALSGECLLTKKKNMFLDSRRTG